MSTKNKYGLVGKQLDYSFSKNYFTKKFKQENIDASYENIEVSDLEDLKAIISEKKILGFNVTIPFKKEILELTSFKTKEVEEIGAANCIQVSDTGEWIAHNTDVIGFERSLLHLIENEKSKALIFGTGGASKAIQFVLKNLKIGFELVSRNNYLNCIQYQDLNKEILTEHKLLINATPVGTYPNITDCLDIPFEFITRKHFFFDLVYNPEKSEFLTRAQDQGAKIQNGIEMLEIQAEESWKIWERRLDD